jgi:hypothetical protein
VTKYDIFFRLTIEKQTVIIVLGTLIGLNLLTLAGFLAMIVAYTRGRKGQQANETEGNISKK